MSPPRSCMSCSKQLSPRGPTSKYGLFSCRAPECKRVYSRALYRLKNPPGERKKRGSCTNCGTAVPNRRDVAGNTYCYALECQRRRNRERQKRFVAQKKAQGIDVYEPYRAGIYARYRARLESGELAPERIRYAERYRDADQRRRALLLGAAIEEFSRIEVFERDGWICQICTLPVDPNEPFPEPGFPSLDHIVPLIRGGDHSRANTQLAHLYCNLVKGASLGDTLVESR